MDSPIFGVLLRYWRKDRHISQQELSLRSGISERQISFLETGRSRPSAKTIEKVAMALTLPLCERNSINTVLESMVKEQSVSG